MIGRLLPHIDLVCFNRVYFMISSVAVTVAHVALSFQKCKNNNTWLNWRNYTCGVIYVFNLYSCS